MQQKKVAGVCAGFADYFEVDVTLMRILWLVGTLFTGIPLIAYIIAWIAMPKDYGPAQAAPQT
jgi:phage shock protein PspC (stress-responsive transcriptional regulator)